MSNKAREVKAEAAAEVTKAEAAGATSNVDVAASKDDSKKDASDNTTADKKDNKEEDKNVSKNIDTKPLNKSDESLPKKVSFNDNHVEEPAKLSNPTSDDNLKSPSILKRSAEEKPPNKPARPLSAKEKAKKTLKEAFPNTEEKYIDAVLIASEGDLDPAFNALLYLSDPDSRIEIPEPKAKPPVPPKNRQKNWQLEEDERLARRLAREFQKSNSSAPQRPPRPDRPPKPVRKDRNVRRNNDQSDDSEPDMFKDFIDEDLPQIKKQFEEGFKETRTKVGSFFSGFTKQFQDFNNEGSSNGFFNSGNNQGTQYRTDNYNGINSKTNRSRPNRENTNDHRTNTKQSNEEDESKLFGALGSLGSPPTSARSSATFRRDRNYDDDLDDMNHQYSSITMTNNDKDLPEVPVAHADNSRKPSLENQGSTDLYGTPKVSGGGNFDRDEKHSGGGSSKKNSNKWEPLADIAPQPVTDDAFLVTSSDEEDDDDDDKNNNNNKK